MKSKDTRATNVKFCKNDQWKGCIGFETIPNMSKVILYHQFFLHLVEGQIFGDVPLDNNLHIPCSRCKNSKTRAWGMFTISIATLFWSP